MPKKRRVNAAVVLALLACFHCHDAVAAQSKKKPQPSGPAVPEGPILTLEKLIGLVQNVPTKRVLEFLKKRGIDFPATPENMNRLVEVKAAPEILDAVRALSEAQEKAAPAKPIKTGLTLLVTCLPAECEIRLNDKPFTTVNGEIKFDGLNPEAFKVSAWREGYEIDEKIANLKAAKPDDVTRQEFKLRPTAVRQAKWGDTLLKAMLAKANVSRDAKQISGVLTIKEAQTVQWNVIAHITNPGAAEIELSNAQTHVLVSCLDGGCQISAKGSRFKRSPFRGSKQEQMLQEQFLLRHVERWLAHEYYSLVLRLTGVRVTATSNTDPESDQVQVKEFQAGTTAGVYTITLDENSRPKSVKFAAATGLTGAMMVTYSNFQGSYPALTDIRFTDNENQSLSFAAQETTGSSGDAASKK